MLRINEYDDDDDDDDDDNGSFHSWIKVWVAGMMTLPRATAECIRGDARRCSIQINVYFTLLYSTEQHKLQTATLLMGLTGDGISGDVDSGVSQASTGTSTISTTPNVQTSFKLLNECLQQGETIITLRDKTESNATKKHASLTKNT